jgi:hypothetical protein
MEKVQKPSNSEYLSTDFMEQSPSWEVNNPSANQEITYLLWNLKIRYIFHEIPLVVAILNQMNAAHTFISSFCKIRFSTVLQSAQEHQSDLIFQAFRLKSFINFSFPHIVYIPLPSLLFGLITLVSGEKVQIVKLIIIAIFLHPHIVSAF